MATTSTVRLDGDGDHARPRASPRLSEDTDLVAASVSRDWTLVPTGDDDADGGMEVEEVDLEPRPRTGVPKTMRELAESYAQRQEEVMPPPPSPPREKEGDLAMAELEGQRGRVLEGGASRRGSEGPGRRTTRGRPGTRTTRTSRKRARRRSESEGASDGDGEEVDRTPPKRRQLEASVSPVAVAVPSLASTPNPNPNPNPGSGRVLRPRPQKSAGRLREERAMEEAYRRAVAG